MSELVLPIPPLPQAMLARLASDEQLARLVSRGHPQAFAVLYERHQQALLGYCRSIVRNGDDAQDALQSALMLALAALQRGERDLAVRPWLFRIVHNEAVSLLRRRAAVEPGLAGRETHAEVPIERTLEQRERLSALVSDLQSLAERQRAVLVMRELAGLSIAEIAAALSTSPGAAKQALFEARSALHEIADGRAMACEGVRQTISERDGRLLRGRKIRAHLTACGDCRDFRSLIHTRSSDLRASLPVLPASAASAALANLLGATAGTSGGGMALGGSAATLGGSASVSLTLKALTGVTLMAAATAGTVQLEASDHHRRSAPLAGVHGARHARHGAPLLAFREARARVDTPVVPARHRHGATEPPPRRVRTLPLRAPARAGAPHAPRHARTGPRPGPSAPPPAASTPPVTIAVDQQAPVTPPPSPPPAQPADTGVPPPPVPPVTTAPAPPDDPQPSHGHDGEPHHPPHPHPGSGDSHGNGNGGNAAQSGGA